VQHILEGAYLELRPSHLWPRALRLAHGAHHRITCQRTASQCWRYHKILTLCCLGYRQ